MTTTNLPRTRIALRLLSTAFLVTALLASGGTASAAKKKTQSKTPAASKEETPPAPAAPTSVEEVPAPATPAAAAPAPAAAAPAEEPMAPTPAAAPAPAATKPEPAAASPQRKRTGEAAELGLSPQTTSYAADNKSTLGESEAPTEDWGFKFHGFFRGPMRLSMDHESGPGRGIQFHAPPVTVDSNYTTWSYTNNNPGPWGELILQYGNNRAIMTAAIASYNITSGGWRELQDQLGIDRAFLTLYFPDLFGDFGKLTANVGVFSDRYGAMGKYDGGAYDTYMIGRTRVAGETLTFEFDIADDFKLVIEHGIGAKMDVQKWKGYNDITHYVNTTWEPFPGYAQQGTTLLHHAHVGLLWANMLTLTGHYMYAWTKDAMRTSMNGQNSVPKPDTLPSPNDQSDTGWDGTYAINARDGSMRILGADLRLDGGWMGIGYLGFSSIKCSNAGVLMDAIEVIHSQGGWQFTNNYLGAAGNGTVNSIGFQYTFSLAAFLMRPQAWWGQGADLTLQVFGMANLISGIASPNPNYNITPLPNSTDPSNGWLAPSGGAYGGWIKGPDGFGTKKFKVGGQALYTPFAVMSVGARFDYVEPNLDNSTHNFWVISPRLVFRTQFVTHEQIILQYQYYSYGSWYMNTANNMNSLPFPYGGGGPQFYPAHPDKQTVTIAASMWW
jgi:hypothetical protein